MVLPRTTSHTVRIFVDIILLDNLERLRPLIEAMLSFDLEAVPLVPGIKRELAAIQVVIAPTEASRAPESCQRSLRSPRVGPSTTPCHKRRPTNRPEGH